jgi:K+:H+ antiporter
VQIGGLLNTRGLTELVVLNVGRELGILGPGLFAMLVLVALVSTAMAAPIVRWARAGLSEQAADEVEPPGDRADRVAPSPQPAGRGTHDGTHW